MRGVNDDEAPALLAFACATGISCGSSSRCRWMPSTAGTAPRWSPPTRSSSRLATDLHPDAARGAAGRRARRAVRRDRSRRRTGQVGIIASVTRPFCGDCDRTRLTADGQIRNCLFSRDRDRPAGAAARRRRRRRDRRRLAGGDVGQAARPRHQRPVASCSRTGRCRRSVADDDRRRRVGPSPSPCATTPPLRPRRGVEEERSRRCPHRATVRSCWTAASSASGRRSPTVLERCSYLLDEVAVHDLRHARCAAARSWTCCRRSPAADRRDPSRRAVYLNAR